MALVLLSLLCRVRRRQDTRPGPAVPVAEHVGELDTRGQGNDGLSSLAADTTKDTIQSHQQER